MRLPAALAEQMTAHVRSCLPNEGCGLLGGDADRIEVVYCLDNVEASPDRYTIEPEGHFRALQDAERRGLELVGAFHSHIAAAAWPSATDVDQAAEPDWLWVIIGPLVGSTEVRAFRIRDGVVAEEELVVEAL